MFYDKIKILVKISVGGHVYDTRKGKKKLEIWLSKGDFLPNCRFFALPTLRNSGWADYLCLSIFGATFFLITGYYAHSKDELWIQKKALSLLKLTFVTEFLYFVWFTVDKCLIKHGKFFVELSSLPFLKHPIRTVLFGTCFNGTLWYLYAAFWTYIIFLIFRKVHFSEKLWAYHILPLILLFTQVFGRYYVQNRADLDIYTYIHVFRSAPLLGLPLTMIGAILARQEKVIRKNLSFFVNICIIFTGHLIIVAEYFISGQYLDFHLSTLVISIGLFLLAFTYEKTRCPLKEPLSYIGRDLSMWIYLVQNFVISVLNEVELLCFPTKNTIFLIAKPLLACAGSIFLAIMFSVLKRKYHRPSRKCSSNHRL